MNNKIIYLEQNKVVFANGVFGIGYHLELPEKYSMGEQDYVSINNYWNKALKDLPISTIFYKQDTFLKTKFDATNFLETNFLEKATKKHFQDREYLKHDCYLFFILPSQDLINETLINPFKKLNKKEFDGFDEKINAFISSVNTVILTLNSVKLNGGNRLIATEMSSTFINDYYDLYFNLFESNHISDRFFNQTNVNIGTKYASMLCMLDETKLPDSLTTHQKDNSLRNDKTEFFKNYGENFAFDLNFSHVYNQIFFVDDNRKHLNDLRKRNNQLHKSSNFDKENAHYAQVTDEMITDIVSNIDTLRLIRGQNNIIIIADTEAELEKNTLIAKEQFRDIDVTPYLPTGNFLNALYNNSFPFFTQYLTENQLYIASLEIFCSFLNNTGNNKSDNQGVIYNSRLTNTPVVVDIWDEKKKYINARNFTIYAPTGYGKSFNANHIITHFLNVGTKVVLIDLGGSYQKLSFLYPETSAYISFKEGEPLGINPFKVSAINSTIIEELVEFIGIHYKRGEEVTEIEKTSLRKLIEEYYNRPSAEYSLPNFVEFIEKNKNILKELNIESEFFKRKEFLHLMSEFVGTGAYAYLYKSTDRDLGDEIKDKDLIVFELDKARGNRLLLIVMLQLIYSVTNTVIWEDKSRKGCLLFDEVAEQLQWEGMLRRIQYYFQAIRKQNSSVGMILQSESQLPESPLSKSIVENTQIIYVLYAKDYRSLQKRYGLSEHAYYQLCSIQSNFSGARPYSEIFIIRGNVHQVYRLEVPKQVYWAYQTEGEENQKLLEIYNKSGNMETAINEYITLN